MINCIPTGLTMTNVSNQPERSKYTINNVATYPISINIIDFTMAPTNKRYRSSRSSLACRRKQARLLRYWKESNDDIEECNLSNNTGRSRTEHENKLILCSLSMLLGTYLRLAMENKKKITEVSWRLLYDEVSSKLHVKRQYVVDLHRQLVDEGCVLLFGHGDGSKRGPKEEIHRKLNQVQVQSIVDRVDDYHADGRTITNREIRNYLTLEHQITLSKMTISNYFKRLGLTWKRVSNKRRGMGAYRKDLLRQFMIDVDKVINDENCIIVGTDESYIHRNHCSKFSYVTKKEITIGRSNNKGERLIIMYTISPHGPLAEQE
jgi:transposase